MGHLPMPLSQRAAVVIALLTAGLLFSCWWSLSSLNELKVNGPVYDRIVRGKDLIADVLPPPVYIIESYLMAHQLLNTHDAENRTALVERLKALKAEFEMRCQFWSNVEPNEGPAGVSLTNVQRPAAAFYRAAFGDFIPALENGDAAGADAAMLRMKGSFEQHRNAIKQLVTLTTKRQGEVESLARSRATSADHVLLAFLSGAVALALGLLMLTTRSIALSLHVAVRTVLEPPPLIANR